MIDEALVRQLLCGASGEITCRGIVSALGFGGDQHAVKIVTGIIRRLVRDGTLLKTAYVKTSRTACAWTYRVNGGQPTQVTDFISTAPITREATSTGAIVRFGSTWKAGHGQYNRFEVSGCQSSANL